MSLKDQMVTDWDTLANADEFAETVTITPLRGLAVVVTRAVWDERDPNTDNGSSTNVQGRKESVIVLLAQWPTPSREATVLRSTTGEGWTVTDVIHLDASAVRLVVARQKAVTRARDVGGMK